MGAVAAPTKFMKTRCHTNGLSYWTDRRFAASAMSPAGDVAYKDRIVRTTLRAGKWNGDVFVGFFHRELSVIA